MLRLVLDSVFSSLTLAALVAGAAIAFLSLTLLNVIPNATRNFEGTVVHSRRKNSGSCKAHKFSYNISMDLVDLDDPPTKRCHHFPAFLSLKRCKHISGSACLKLTVLARLQKCAAEAKKYKVYLLTNLAVLGHTFNPISVYYVFEQSRLVNIVAEVTNIPWHEKTTYILHIDDGNQISNRIHEKKLHVSPFNPHNKQLYKFDFSIRPSAAEAGAASMQALFFSIQVYDRDTHASNLVMTVSYSLSASPFRLLRGVRPLFTIVRIHYQAAKLWAKRFVVYEHPLRRSKTSDDARNYIRNTE